MAVTCDCLPPGTQYACSTHEATLEETQQAYSVDGRTGEDIPVHMNMSRVLVLPEAPESLVIGNEQILDVSFLDDRTLVMNGLGEGATNLIAVSSDGRVIENRIVQVMDTKAAVTTIIRDQSRETFLCGETCVPAPNATGPGVE